MVSSPGAKYWRYDYRFAGKRKILALGVYPRVSLKDAREKHLEARNKLSKGIDPADFRKSEKQTRNLAADSFEAIAGEWFQAKMRSRSEQHRSRTLRALEKDLFPPLGNRPIASITSPELLAALRKIEGRGAIETAHGTKQTASQIFRYAIASGRAERDVGAADLRGALKETKEKHFASITDPKEVGPLLVAIEGFRGSQVVLAALRISPLLFQRPGEIRHMEWTEINWDDKPWELPAEKMKMGSPIEKPAECKECHKPANHTVFLLPDHLTPVL